MPLIRIDFDNQKVSENEVVALSNAVQKIVAEITKIEDVFVYANNSQIKVKVAPIEIFIEMTASKISDADALVAEIKSQLSTWKKENNFQQPVNLTLMPMEWKVEIAI